MIKWTFFHPLAKPEVSYHLALRLQSIFLSLAWILCLVGLVWGLYFAPTDYQQGDAFRIIYVHVPAAVISMMAYSLLASCGVVTLIWQMPLSGFMIPAIAPIGAAFTAIALLTGAIWGKPMWGTWWVWDARLTSELILLFLFIGVSALYHLFEDKKQAASAASILGVVGVINLPIIHFSVEWWNSLHQGSTLFRLSGPAIAPQMLWPLLMMLLSFAFFLLGLSLLRFCRVLLHSGQGRTWTQALLQGDSA